MYDNKYGNSAFCAQPHPADTALVLSITHQYCNCKYKLPGDVAHKHPGTDLHTDPAFVLKKDFQAE